MLLKRLVMRLPIRIFKGFKAKGVSLGNRISNAFTGSPNWRRGLGIVSAKFEAELIISRFRKTRELPGFNGFKGKPLKSVPIFSIDRCGSILSEDLPRIWLSEITSNTSVDDGRRVMVECYPSDPDNHGDRALELAERYIGEGCDRKHLLTKYERIECFKAAEILLLHAISKGNIDARHILQGLYSADACEGDYWQPLINEKAKHALRRDPSARSASYYQNRKAAQSAA